MIPQLNLNDQYALEGTPLIGEPVCITLTYLGNVQIIEILLQGKKVSFIKKIPKSNNQSIAELVARYGVNLIKEKEIRERIFIVLALKVESYVSSQQLFISTLDQKTLSPRKRIADILLEGGAINRIQLRHSLIDKENLAEISKVFFISGMSKNIDFDFYYCNNFFFSKDRLSPPELPKRYKELIKNWFKNNSIYGNAFDFYENTLVDLRNHPDILCLRFENLVVAHHSYFRIDPKVIYACLQESIKPKSYLSIAEITLYSEVSKQMDNSLQRIKLRKFKSPIIDDAGNPETKNKTSPSKEYVAKSISSIRKKLPNGSDCFLVPPDFNTSNDLQFCIVLPCKYFR